MNTINNGGPAFPAGSIRKSRSAADPGADFVVTDVVAPKQPGMTMRDYFAAKAMPSLLSTATEFPDEHWMVGVAVDAYAMADAMLAAREGKTESGEA